MDKIIGEVNILDITKKKKPFTDNETSSLINDYIQFPFMIIDNFPNFIQRVIKNSEDDFYHIVHGCRHCGYAGNLHRHASYHRTIICKQITARVRIQRVICPNCKKTHAIIPSHLIPYFQHTLETIVKLLEFILSKRASYSQSIKIYRSFNLSFSSAHINLYMRRFKSNINNITYFYRVFCNIFLEPTASAAEILSELFELEYKVFNKDYFNKMNMYFLAKVKLV